MKVLHSGNFDVNTGGPAMSTYHTLYGLRQLGLDVSLISYPLSQNGTLIGKEVPVHFASKPLDNKLLYSTSFKKQVQQLGAFDLYHAQGVWQFPTYALADLGRKLNKPYLITPRGMLYPQDIAKSNKMFKELSLWLRLLKDLNRAACVHVTCEEEMEHCRRLGVTSPIAIIPNPIPFTVYSDGEQSATFRLGYLGRLSPRKNIEGLIYAWAELGEQVHDAELFIIGSDDQKYEDFLKSEVQRLGLKNVVFTGFLSGEVKDQVLCSLSVLAMPSEFENFGNVILEGLIRRVPCIATKGAPWQELTTHDCGWWIDYEQTALTEAIQDALNRTPEELMAMGERGEKLVRTEYTVEAVAMKMKKLYTWILSKGEKPDFVYL